VGYIFDVITNGFGAMPDYAAQIQPRDRWAIVAYVRALQLSQNASVNDVPPAKRAALGQEGAKMTGAGSRAFDFAGPDESARDMRGWRTRFGDRRRRGAGLARRRASSSIAEPVLPLLHLVVSVFHRPAAGSRWRG
jgi:hypothetical protein